MQQLRESLTQADPTHDLVGSAVRNGDPATEILQYARVIPADLIVMGAPAADRPERPLGPVASVVIDRSGCPVLAVPSSRGSSNESGTFSRIVCGIDWSPSSATVIRQALSLAWETGGRLTYICVIPKTEALSSVAEIREKLLSAIPPEADGWCELDVIVQTGVPNAEIVRLVTDRTADLVVVGAPRRWASTTHAVLSHSLCPVLVTHDAQPLPWPAARSHESDVLTGMNRSRT